MRKFGILSFHKFWKSKNNHGLERTIFWKFSSEKVKKKFLFAKNFKPKLENPEKMIVRGYFVRSFNFYFPSIIF